MRIVIFGAGTVGASIAELLCHHGHSVTVVDASAEHARALNESLDVRTVTGSASQSSVLFQAGAMQADLCLAVTGDDEVNLVSASMAKAMGSRRTVARVYAPVFRDLSTFDYQRHFQIDELLSLEHLSAMELARGIRHSESITVEHFARGELEMSELTVAENTEAVDVPIKEMGLPRGVLIGTICRDGRMRIAGAEDRLEAEDQITLIGRRDDIDDVTDWFTGKPTPKQGVVIAGGGETGYHLARILEGRRFAVVLMEAGEARCNFLASNLARTTVINSDATRRRVLEEERVGSADVFVACTGDDENNIVACVEANEIGSKMTMAIVSRPDYASVVGKLGIDLAVSPRKVMAKQVLGFLTSGPVVSRMPLAGGAIEVLEVDVVAGAPATEHVLANLALPNQCLVPAVISEDYVRVPGADDRLRAGDRVVILAEETVIDDALKLFYANGTPS